jgi:hypothetical protein
VGWGVGLGSINVDSKENLLAIFNGTFPICLIHKVLSGEELGSMSKVYKAVMNIIRHNPLHPKKMVVLSPLLLQLLILPLDKHLPKC